MADVIYVLHKGRLIALCTHAQLLNLQGKYARMFHEQAKSYRWTGLGDPGGSGDAGTGLPAGADRRGPYGPTRVAADTLTETALGATSGQRVRRRSTQCFATDLGT